MAFQNYIQPVKGASEIAYMALMKQTLKKKNLLHIRVYFFFLTEDIKHVGRRLIWIFK